VEESIALIGRFVIALVALLLGATFVRWGVHLYRDGVIAKAGTLKTIWKDSEFVLTNGAPGTFLSVGGIIVMAIALLTMPGYDGENRRVAERPDAAGAVQQYVGTGLSGPLPVVTSARPPQAEEAVSLPASRRVAERSQIPLAPSAPIAVASPDRSDTAAHAGPDHNLPGESLPKRPASSPLDARGYLVVLAPREWTGEGSLGITRSRRPVRVEGLVYHVSGIRTVSINGVEAILRPGQNGTFHFSGRLTATELERDVEIVAYPAEGEPITRIQRPDGTHSFGSRVRADSLPASRAASSP
jgi:hypothetical protein